MEKLAYYDVYCRPGSNNVHVSLTIWQSFHQCVIDLRSGARGNGFPDKNRYEITTIWYHFTTEYFIQERLLITGFQPEQLYSHYIHPELNCQPRIVEAFLRLKWDSIQRNKSIRVLEIKLGLSQCTSCIPYHGSWKIRPSFKLKGCASLILLDTKPYLSAFL